MSRIKTVALGVTLIQRSWMWIAAVKGTWPYCCKTARNWQTKSNVNVFWGRTQSCFEYDQQIFVVICCLHLQERWTEFFFSSTFLHTSQFTLRHVPENRKIYNYCHKKLSSIIFFKKNVKFMKERTSNQMKFQRNIANKHVIINSESIFSTTISLTAENLSLETISSKILNCTDINILEWELFAIILR